MNIDSKYEHYFLNNLIYTHGLYSDILLWSLMWMTVPEITFGKIQGHNTERTLRTLTFPDFYPLDYQHFLSWQTHFLPNQFRRFWIFGRWSLIIQKHFNDKFYWSMIVENILSLNSGIYKEWSDIFKGSLYDLDLITSIGELADNWTWIMSSKKIDIS